VLQTSSFYAFGEEVYDIVQNFIEIINFQDILIPFGGPEHSSFDLVGRFFFHKLGSVRVSQSLLLQRVF
jgi:hypothetical protein